MSLSHEQLDRLGKEIAASLGGSWTWRPNQPDWAPGGVLREVDDGVELYVGNTSGRKPSITIAAQPPKDSRGQVPHVASQSRPAISVSAAKRSEQIAWDIERRLLPEWLPIYEQALAAIAESNRHEEASTSAAAEIAAIVGVPIRVGGEARHKISFYGSPHPIFHETISGAEISGNEVHLDLSLSREDAIVLLRFLTQR